MKNAVWMHLSFLGMFVLSLVTSPARAVTQRPDMPVYQALTQTSDWLNTSRPLKEDDLEGRILLVDFWTYCCINCIHVIPKLQTLEKEFGDKLTVIGVHSAKFTTEGETANIREAIQKYEIEHPVVNDADFRIWNAFGINAWPTVLLIDTNGLLKQVYRGEGDIETMRRDIATLIKQNSDKLVTSKLPLALEKDKLPPTLLQFPTKLALDGDRLIISDSGHHRIVIGDLKSKKVIATVGNGKQGFADGSFEQAQFNAPQGVLTDGDKIYVADTGNHRIRLIDLTAKTVTTIAGTGERGGYAVRGGSTDALKTALASPWDLAFYPDRDTITIANAGSHQLWQYHIKEKELSVIAGSGQESIDDGALPSNSLSQPSGLSVRGDRLYFVDAETSSLRVFDGKNIQTLIGTGLFDFGLQDGGRGSALMQHATGLFADKNAVYIADTYNHAIRKYQNGALSTLPIKGLKEPNAIVGKDGTFYIADTNNHRIVTMNADGKMTGIVDFMPQEKPIAYERDLPNPLPEIKASTGEKAEVILDLPQGWHINEAAPSYLVLFDEAKNPVTQFKTTDLRKDKIKLPLEAGKPYELQGILYYCEDAEGSQCLIRGVSVKLTATDKSDKVELIKITLPK